MLNSLNIALQGLFELTPLALAIHGLLGIEIPTPSNGPSGGANWLRGYKPTHDYSPKRRRNRRDELLICRA